MSCILISDDSEGSCPILIGDHFDGSALTAIR